MFRYFCYLYLVLPVAGNADIHNTGKCLALFSGNESDNSKQVENKLISLRLKQAWAVAYFKQSVDRCLNLINRILRRFCRGFGNDLENVRNSLHCVTILSNNPYFAQRYENLFGFQSKFNSLS